jgi:beta-lactam-binding protein with PASTA domain
MNIPNFFRKHPLVANFLLAALVVIVLVIVLLSWLKSYTNHGEAVEIPDVKGLLVEDAASLLQTRELNYEVIDSLFVKNAVVGTIVETVPPIGTPVKKGRKIYLTINSFSSQLITIPDVIETSQRQAVSILKSLGFESIQERIVPGDFRDLVVGLETKGKTIFPGDKVPSNSRLVILVSSGIKEISQGEEEDGLGITEEESWN